MTTRGVGAVSTGRRPPIARSRPRRRLRKGARSFNGPLRMASLEDGGGTDLHVCYIGRDEVFPNISDRT